jgi:hypothetical protein
MQRQLDVWDAFKMADADNAGLLTGAKLWALHDFLGVECDEMAVVSLLFPLGISVECFVAWTIWAI